MAVTASGGRGLPVAPIMLVLAAAVLVPTACVLWFLNAAMRNERLAVRQKLADSYLRDMRDCSAELDRRLADLFTRTVGAAESGEGPATLPGDSRAAAAAFKTAIATQAVDALVVLDADGETLYPLTLAAAASLAASPPPRPTPDSPAAPLAAAADASPPQEAFASPPELPEGVSRAAAARLEQRPGWALEAAATYALLAEAAASPGERAALTRDRLRCLLTAGASEQAREMLEGFLTDPAMRSARDATGRLVYPDLLLAALELAEGPRRAAHAADLTDLLLDYAAEPMPSAQRLFIMTALGELESADSIELEAEDAALLRRLARAERLALAWLERPRRSDSPPELLARPGQGLAWQAALAGGRLVLLLEALPVGAAELAALADGAEGVDFSLRPAGQAEGFVRRRLSTRVEGVDLVAELQGDNPLVVAAERQRGLYLWTAAVALGAFAALLTGVAGYIRRQMKLARLKNDLVATVSHELKTPLAAMRLLVDTLLEDRAGDAATAREYLGMIARENERLTRLIDNFLTFSRMERNKRVLRPQRVEVRELFDRAAAAVADRFDGRAARLEIEPPEGPLSFDADGEAALTAVVNLLDNAWKYSGADKQVSLRARCEGQTLHIEVADNGIGMSRRDIRRIFERFYQADKRLTRTAGGCGLGLSIVKFIMDAHGGSVDVESRPGRGSVFTLRFPREAQQGPAH